MQVKRKEPRFKSIITALLFISLLSYFTFHAVSGERGLLAMIQLEKQANKTRMEMESIHAEKLALEHKVNMLRESNLDDDLLDEQARKLLGYAATDEVVYTISY